MFGSRFFPLFFYMIFPLLRLILASAFVFLLAISLTFGQTIVYVTQSGAGNQSGSSWGNALPGVQLRDRLASVAGGTQFWIGAGTYKPSVSRGESFALKNNVGVYGGFVGTEISLSQRPAFSSSNPSSTTLSGDLGIIGNRNDNAYNVFLNNGVNGSAILDGVVIADGATAPFGGGMLNNGSGVGNQCSPTIRNCLFANNSAEQGGAVYNLGTNGGVSSPTFTNCVFLENRAFSTFGGAVHNDATGGTSSPTFTNCRFIANRSGDRGGAIAVAASSNSGTSNPVLTNCVFSQNTADYGGAISVSGGVTSSLTLLNSVFTGNVATTYGGAIHIRNSSGTINTILTNCTAEGNRVLSQSNFGAAIFNEIASSQVNVRLSNCITRNNLGQSGSNVGALSAFGPDVYSITYSNIQGGFAGTGNIDADPLFVNVGGGNFRLQPGSPSINTGDPASTTSNVSATDLGGNNRIDNGRIDMGVYERQTPAGPIVTTQPGNWNDPFTWQFQQVPGATDAVLIRHRVALPLSYTGNARAMQYDASGQLVFLEGTQIKFN